jgi:hypothetical protein
MLTRLSAFLLAALALSGAAAAHAAGPKPGPVAYVTLETRDFRVEIAGDRAWTISRIVHRGAEITGRTGFYGTVFSAQGGQWIGTGHNEGGVEKVEQAVLTVDGETRELTDGAVHRGARLELRKRSFLGPIRLEAVCTVTDDAILERHRYQFTEEVKVGRMYAFMHPFLPSTKAWLAETADGRRVDGGFDESGAHRLREDVRWTAIHDPTARRATLVWSPEVIEGPDLKTFYWDKNVYHKLYHSIYAQTTVPAGTHREVAVELRCIEAGPQDWQLAVARFVEELQQQRARQGRPE